MLHNMSKPQENINKKSIYDITVGIKKLSQKTFYSNSPFQLSEIHES